MEDASFVQGASRRSSGNEKIAEKESKSSRVQKSSIMSQLAKTLVVSIITTLLITYMGSTIFTILPCNVFRTKSVERNDRIAATIVLFLGTIAHLVQRLLIERTPMDTENHPELKHVFFGASFLAICGSPMCIVTCVLGIFVHHSIDWYEFAYFVSLGSFLASLLVLRWQWPFTVMDYAPNPDSSMDNVITFFCKHFLWALLIGEYFAINIYEAKETLSLYEPRGNCTTVGEFTSHQAYVAGNEHTDWASKCHEFFTAAAYALAVEVFVLLMVAEFELKKLRKHNVKTTSADNDRSTDDVSTTSTSASDRDLHVDAVPHHTIVPVDQPGSSQHHADDPNHGQHDEDRMVATGVAILRDSLAFMNKISWSDKLAIGFGTLSALTSSTALFVYLFIESTSSIEPAKNLNVMISKTVYFGVTGLYALIAHCLIRPCKISERRLKETFGLLDVVLLRWSNYGLILLIVLIFFGVLWSPPCMACNQFALNCVSYALNIIQGWAQYYLIYHLMAWKCQLKITTDGAWTTMEVWRQKLAWYALPVFVANLFYFVYNLFQWKTIRMLPMAHERDSSRLLSPGIVWALTEAILFPVCIFFRFHAAFLCSFLIRAGWKSKMVLLSNDHHGDNHSQRPQEPTGGDVYDSSTTPACNI